MDNANNNNSFSLSGMGHQGNRPEDYNGDEDTEQAGGGEYACQRGCHNPNNFVNNPITKGLNVDNNDDALCLVDSSTLSSKKKIIHAL